MLAIFEKSTYSSPRSLQSRSKPTGQPAPPPASHFSPAYLAGPSCRKIACTLPVLPQNPPCCPSPGRPLGTPSSSQRPSYPVPALAADPESYSAHSTPASWCPHTPPVSPLQRPRESQAKPIARSDTACLQPTHRTQS